MSSALDSNIIAEELIDLVRRTANANSALLNGDVSTYLALIRHAADCTLMAPFGGAPKRGFDPSTEQVAELSRFFQSGEAELELVQSHASGDLAVLVMIERQHAEVGGLPDQDWSLRVTQIYRREGTEWRLAHRHADPLVKSISLERAAALARG